MKWSLLVFVCLLGAVCACAVPVVTEKVWPLPPVGPNVDSLFVPPALWESSVEIAAYLDEAPKEHATTLLVYPLEASETEEEFAAVALGSGTVVYQRGGVVYILTAHHVIEGAKKVVVWRTGVAGAVVEVIKEDKANDLALLRATEPLFAQVVRVAPRSETLPPVGAHVFVAGNQWGEGMRVTHGLFSSDLPQRVKGGTFARLSAPVLPGASGGGVWASGRLIGVVSRVCVGREPRQIFTHMGLFVPPKAISEFLGRLGE
jgi:S1-C subfamily serine protease